MRLLFKMDGMDYDRCTHTRVRNSARAIIIRSGKLAMMHSLKYDYYKFPGGGIRNRETDLDALIRETREETGLLIKPETIKEFGYVHRIQRSHIDRTECFVQDNYYYLCDVQNKITKQDLDEYEAEESFTLEYIMPYVAIKKNRKPIRSPYSQMMFEREAAVLEILIKERII